jgi:hypothetical protein
MQMLTAQKAASDFVPAVIICGVFIAASVTASVMAFNKKQL